MLGVLWRTYVERTKAGYIGITPDYNDMLYAKRTVVLGIDKLERWELELSPQHTQQLRRWTHLPPKTFPIRVSFDPL